MLFSFYFIFIIVLIKTLLRREIGHGWIPLPSRHFLPISMHLLGNYYVTGPELGPGDTVGIDRLPPSRFEGA